MLFAVGEDFDVSQAGRVIDADVHVLPADEVAAHALGVGAAARGPALARLAGEAMSGAAMDPAELLDVDVDQFARRGLQPDTGPATCPRCDR